jgi:hypothetical protein
MSSSFQTSGEIVKKRVIVLGIAAVLVAAAVTAVIVVRVNSGGDENSASDTQSPQSFSSPIPFTLPQADVAALESGLVSTDPAVEAKALSAALPTTVKLDTGPLLPAGSHIAIDAGNATRFGDLVAVPATVTGPRPGQFSLLLTREGESWLLYGTEQLD